MLRIYRAALISGAASAPSISKVDFPGTSSVSSYEGMDVVCGVVDALRGEKTGPRHGRAECLKRGRKIERLGIFEVQDSGKDKKCLWFFQR